MHIIQRINTECHFDEILWSEHLFNQYQYQGQDVEHFRQSWSLLHAPWQSSCSPKGNCYSGLIQYSLVLSVFELHFFSWSTSCWQESFILSHMAVAHPFSLLCNTSLFVYTQQFIHPLYGWWAFCLLSVFDYYKQFCCEHSWACLLAHMYAFLLDKWPRGNMVSLRVSGCLAFVDAS